MDRQKIRLLIAENDARLREALAVYLMEQDGIEVVGEAADDAQARALARRLEPDVVLIDPHMKPRNAVELVQTLRQENANTQIIVLSSTANTALAQQFTEAGAASYVEKGVLASELLDVIHRVSRQDE